MSQIQPITCLIVDDEPLARQNLSDKLNKLFGNQLRIIGMVKSVKEAKASISQIQPQIIFLDITMPNEDGFKLLEEKNIENCEIIFVTAHNEYALKAFQYCAAGYVLKPLDNDHLKLVVTKAINHLNAISQSQVISNLKNYLNNGPNNTKIAIHTYDGIELLDTDSIIYIEATDGYCKFHNTKGRQVLSSKRLTYYETLLDSVHFAQVHRSIIVNKKYVTRIDKRSMRIILGDISLPLSKSKKDELLDQFLI